MKSSIDYYKIFKYTIIPVDFVLILLLVLDFFKLLPIFWNSLWVFYILLIINTAFLALRLNKMPESEREHDFSVFWAKYLFLLGLVILAVNQFLKRQVIIDYMSYIIGVTIALGFLTFFASRTRVEREIDDEKASEEAKEKKRKEEFSQKFPGINKIPVLRSIVKWMYKEGWWYSIPFVIIAIIFIAIKIAMPIIYTGSYVDETVHLLSGVEFFKTGHFAQLYYGQYYNRGAYVSFLVGLSMYLFGQTLFAAKMVPALIGIINFFLLYWISRKIITRKKYILLLMVIYTISPWVIFNDFYIRLYIFYEFFLLLSVYLFFRMVNSINNNKILISILYFFIFFLLSLFEYFLSVDMGIYLIIFVNILFTIYGLFCFKRFFKNNRYFIYSLCTLLFILFIIAFIILDIPFLFNELFYTSVTNTPPENLKFSYYFLNLNFIFTIFFFLSLVLINKFGAKESFFTVVISILFFIHLISSKDLQMMRVIMYLLPLYFLLAILSLSKINFKIMSVLLILLLMVVYNNYPPNFLEGPYIPKEVTYKDYKIASDYINSNYNTHSMVLISSQPQLNLFLGTKFTSIYLLRDNKLADYDKNVEYFDKDNNVTRSSLTKVIVVDTSYQFNEIITSEDNVVVLLDSDFAGWVTPQSLDILKNNFVLVKRFNSLSLYKKL